MTKDVQQYGKRIGQFETDNDEGVTTIFLYEYLDTLFFIEAHNGNFSEPTRTANIEVGDHSFYINLNCGLIRTIETKAIPVVYNTEFVYKLMKTQLKGIDGITGLTKYLFKLSDYEFKRFVNNFNGYYNI